MKSHLKKLAMAAIILIASAAEGVAAIAVLDITERNKESQSSGDWARQLYSAMYMCDIAGYDYTVCTDIEDAKRQDVILLSSCITSSTFSRDEWESLEEWVKNGGVLVSNAFRSVSSASRDVVASIFGIDPTASGTKSNDRPIINWNPEYYGDIELEYIDEENERATSIGSVKSYSLTVTSADVLANFGSDTPAVSRNKLGDGAAYLVQVPWRDVIARSQLNKDQSASREYNNGFEPSSDVWALFLRSITAKALGVSAWKFTVPGGYTQLLVPTHDCDSRTAYDSMHWMADYEKSMGFRGHYFLTVHYYSDKVNFGHSYLSDFYNAETIPAAKQLIADGHTVGSHSICHFPDFNKTRNTDIVTRDEYAHRATCIDGTSQGVSTWAEIVLSKQILEGDLGNKVRSFRSGHLCVNPDFHAMMEEGNYSFQSCYTGGDLLSEFPFFGRIDNAWDGDQSDVLTMQLHISDVYSGTDKTPLNDDNWNEHPCSDQWFAAMQKLHGNYASAILLIHPNREWKMTLQKRLVNRLDLNEVGLYNFEDYGDFWLARLNAGYSHEYNKENGVLTITADTETVKKYKMTFAVDVYDENFSDAVIKNTDGSETLDAELRRIADHRYIVIPKDFRYGQSGVDEMSVGANSLSGIFDLGGRAVYVGEDVESAMARLPKGIYIVKEGNTTKKLKI